MRARARAAAKTADKLVTQDFAPPHFRTLHSHSTLCNELATRADAVFSLRLALMSSPRPSKEQEKLVGRCRFRSLEIASATATLNVKTAVPQRENWHTCYPKVTLARRRGRWLHGDVLGRSPASPIWMRMDGFRCSVHENKLAAATPTLRIANAVMSCGVGVTRLWEIALELSLRIGFNHICGTTCIPMADCIQRHSYTIVQTVPTLNEPILVHLYAEFSLIISCWHLRYRLFHSLQTRSGLTGH